MSNQQDSSSKGLVIIITAVIGTLGTIAVAYFAFRGAVFPAQLEIEATQTAHSIQSTQMASNIWITQTAQSIEATKFAESIMATQSAAAPIQASSNSSPADTPVPSPTVYVPPPTAAPIVVSNTYDIWEEGGISGTQRSTPLDYVITVWTVDFLQIGLKVGEGSCSDVFFHILWDGNEIFITDRLGGVSGRYSTGTIDLSQYISQGNHKLTISPEGITGGCNSGTLGSWAGTLIVHTNEYP